MKVYHGSSDGKYNLCSNDKQTQVYLYTPAGNFSELFALGDAPYDSDMLPSEVLDIIEQRLDSYWISSSRAKDKERIAKCREQITEFDLIWARDRMERAKKAVAKWEDIVCDLMEQFESTAQETSTRSAEA